MKLKKVQITNKMNPNNEYNCFGFQAQRLNVDWLSFHSKNILDKEDVLPIGLYLANAFQLQSSYCDPKKQQINLVTKRNPEFSDPVRIRAFKPDPKNNEFESGTFIQFSGDLANYFYETIKAKGFDWEKLTLSGQFKLARFDVNFILSDKSQNFMNSKLIRTFFNESSGKSMSVTQSVNIINKPSYRALCIYGRNNNNYFRIYTSSKEPTVLKFEMEIKRIYNHRPQWVNYLNDKQFNEFESSISNHYYNSMKKLLVQDAYFTSWLNHPFRIQRFVKYQQKNKGEKYLVSTYLQNVNDASLKQQEEFVKLIQLFAFLNQKNNEDSIPLTEYLQFIEIKLTPYQIQKHLKFFAAIKTTPETELFYEKGPKTLFLDYFTDYNYKKYVKNFKIYLSKKEFIQKRKKCKSWYIKFESQLMCYPFYFSKTFLIHKNKYELRLKLRTIQSFCVDSLKKILFVQEILQEYNISNQRKTKIKQILIKYLQQLACDDLIEEKVVLILRKGDSNSFLIHNLRPSHLTKASQIVFTEKLNY